MIANGHTGHRYARIAGVVSPGDPAKAELALEARKNAVLRTLHEEIDLLDRLVQPWERWADGTQGRQWLPAGTINDRRRGRDWPLLVTEQDLRGFRAWSRLLCETNYLAIGFLDRLVEFGVGDGYTWQVAIKGASPSAVHTGTTGANTPLQVKNCQKVLDEWRDLASWGAGPCVGDGTDPDDDSGIIQDREQEAFKRWRRDGEVFLRFFKGGRDTEYLPTVRWVEPEQVWTPPGEDQTSAWSWGVLTDDDDNERLLAYYVRDPNGTGMEGEEVPAGRVVHLKGNVDAGVKRGLPDFFPLHDQLQSTKKVLRGMTEVSAILSNIAYLRQHAQNVTQDQIRTMIQQQKDRDLPRTYTPFDGQIKTIPTQYQEPGTIHDISNGMEYVPPPLLAGAPGFIQVVQAMLRAAGARWGMPEYFSGDASNSNMASLLVAGGPFEKACRGRQKPFAMFSRAIAYKVLAFAVQSGRLDADEVRAIEVKVIAPSVAITDKDKEAETRCKEVAAKLISPQTAMAEAGRDPAAEMANMKAFQEQFPDQSLMGFGGEGDGSGTGFDPPKNGFGEGRRTTEGEALPAPGAGHPLDEIGDAILEELGVKVREEHGAPPRPGLVFDPSSHRWVRPDEGTTGDGGTSGSHAAAVSHPEVQGAAERLTRRAGDLARIVNHKLLSLGLTPSAILGDQTSWETWFVTQHADAVAAHIGVDAVTAAHVLSHLASHTIDLVKRRLTP